MPLQFPGVPAVRLNAAWLAAALLHALPAGALLHSRDALGAAPQAVPASPAPATQVQTPAPAAQESRCFGSYAHGRVENAVRLPLNGANFSAYSTAGTMIGRTYVHATVAKIITETYAALHQALPGTVYVYGETGAPTGGRFRPHRTHQNGLSADFFVPVREVDGANAGRSVPLPTETSTFGYDIDFDAAGRFGAYAIDFEAMAEHLFRLDAAAHANGSGIALVLFDQALLPKLFATARGPWLKQNLPFRQGTQWNPHDEHYHVDFALRCAPLPDEGKARGRRGPRAAPPAQPPSLT